MVCITSRVRIENSRAVSTTSCASEERRFHAGAVVGAVGLTWPARAVTKASRCGDAR